MGGWYKNRVWETPGPWGGRSQAGSWCAVAERHQSAYAHLCPSLASGPGCWGPRFSDGVVDFGIGTGGVSVGTGGAGAERAARACAEWGYVSVGLRLSFLFGCSRSWS